MKKVIFIMFIVLLVVLISYFSKVEGIERAKCEKCNWCCMCDHYRIHTMKAVSGFDITRGTIIAGGKIFEDLIKWNTSSKLFPVADMNKIIQIAREYEQYANKKFRALAKQEFQLHIIPLKREEILQIHQKAREIADDIDRYWIESFSKANEIFKKNRSALRAYCQWFSKNQHPKNSFNTFRNFYTASEWEKLNLKYGKERVNEYSGLFD